MNNVNNPSKPGAVPFLTQSQPAKALATPYQNTGLLPRFVLVTIICPAGVTASGICDAAATPTTYVCGSGAIVGLAVNVIISFIVPPSFYYEVTCNTGTLVYWTEYD